jgi:hypothetical protein
MFRRAALLFITLGGLTMSAEAEEGTLAGIDCFAYGYAVEVRVNGTKIGSITGGQSQSVTLMNRNDPDKAEAPPQFHELFVLNEGDNTIAVNFRKLAADGNNRLDFKLRLGMPYAADIFAIDSSEKLVGQVERTFRIETAAPAQPAASIRLTDKDF